MKPAPPVTMTVSPTARGPPRGPSPVTTHPPRERSVQRDEPVEGQPGRQPKPSPPLNRSQSTSLPAGPSAANGLPSTGSLRSRILVGDERDRLVGVAGVLSQGAGDAGVVGES